MPNLKQVMKGKLSAKELAELKRSFDQVGDIAVLEIPKELVRKQKIIANEVLKANVHINTVVKKQGKYAGRYRLREVKWLAGERRTFTQHTESGIRLLLDLATCYFSPRLSSERLRIAKLTKKKEKVLVIGAGVGPYPLVIARHSPAYTVGIELNPKAYEFAVENTTKNKLQNRVKMLKGDAKKWIHLLGKFDRVIVMLPKTGERLWPLAIKAAKKGGMVHLYTFVPEQDMKKDNPKVREICKKQRRSCRVVRVVKAGQPAPRTLRVCLDVRV